MSASTTTTTQTTPSTSTSTSTSTATTLLGTTDGTTSLSTSAVSTITPAVTTTTALQLVTTTPYIPPRNFPPVVENRYRINYWSTCNHYWQFDYIQGITDLGARDTFVRAQVNRRRSYFQTSCAVSQAAVSTPPPDADCCVQCRDEDILVNVPDYNITRSNITNQLNGILSDTVVLEPGLDASDSKAIRFVGSSDTCILLGILANDAPYARSCLQQPEKCDYGLSASVWVNFTEESYVKEVLLATSSGNSQGFQFYTESGRLCVVVTGAIGKWQASVEGFDLRVGRWRLLGFTWERSTGIIRIYIDSYVTTFYYLSTYSEPNGRGAPAAEIRMGCEIADGGRSASHLKAAAIHPAIWLWPISEENLILMTGALVYKLIRYQQAGTSAAPTTAPRGQFAYSTILRDLTYPALASNPYYEVADFYLRAGALLSDLSAANMDSSNVTIVNWLRGSHNEASFRIVLSQAQFNITGVGRTCTAYLELCSNYGISWSLWVLPAQQLPPGGDLEFLRFNIFSLSLKNTSSDSSVLLQVQAGNRSTSCPIVFGKWSNLGLVYDARGSVPVLAVFINAIFCARTSSDSVISLANYNGNVTLGSSSGKGAPAGLLLNHMVVWHRYLEDVEAHRFLGYTWDQLRYIRNGSLYWTTDPVVTSDALVLKDTPGYNLKALYRLNLPNVLGTAITFETDRYNKSLVTRLNSDWLGQLFLGNDIKQIPNEDSISWSGRCLTDPYQRTCQISGLSMHMWLKIKSVDPFKKQFFFSSGDFGDARASMLDSRGISLFTAGGLLGASLSTDKSDWVIMIDTNRFGLDEWFNLGFTWRQQEGMRLFLNGTDYGIVNSHPDMSYKAFDKHWRAVVGRFDDDQNATWKANSDWIMGNFLFSDIVFYDKWMTADEFGHAIGSMNNRYYMGCDLLVWGSEIIDTKFNLIKEAKQLSTPIGPMGNVSRQEANATLIGTNGQVSVKAFRGDECPRRLSACVNQVILSVWLKLKSKSSETPLTVLSMGNETDSFEGFGLHVGSDYRLYAWSKRAGSMVKVATSSDVKIRLNRWVNVCLFLSRGNQYPSIYLNGTNVSSSFEHRAVNPAGVAYQASASAGTLNIGRATATSGSSGVSDAFLVYLLAGWYSVPLVSTQLNNILGVHSSQFDLLRLSDDYWTVNGLWSRLQPYAIRGVNIDFARDRYDNENGAMCTRGTGGSYVSIGDLADTCLVNTAPCMAFILTLMVKPTMPTTTGKSYLLSTGGQTPGQLGIAISLTRHGFLHATVRSPNRTCETSVPFNYSEWVQLQIRWYNQAVITVKVNDDTFLGSSGVNASCWSEINGNMTYSIGHLGKVNSDESKALSACFSDVMFKYQLLGSSGYLNLDLSVTNCYDKQSAYIPLYSAGSFNYQNQANRSRSLANRTESIELGPDICLFSATGCPKGLTLSFWLQVQSLSTQDYADVLSMGFPSSQGLRVRVKKTSEATYLINTEANLAGAAREIVTGDSPSRQWAIGSWTNIGVSVTGSAIEIYVNGVQVKASTQVKSSNLTLASTSVAILGSPSAVLLTSDLVVWNEPPLNCLDPNKNKKLLTGDCSVIDGSLLSTCLPDGAAACSSSIENGMCLDWQVDNVVAIDKSGRLFTTPLEAATACGVLIGTASTIESRIDVFLQSSLSILGRVAANLLVRDVALNNATLADAVASFSRALSAVMDPKFSERFRSIITTGLANPARLFAPVEAFALRLAALQTSSCNPVAFTQGRLHWSAQTVSPTCVSSPIDALQYTDQTRSLWSRAVDTVLLPGSLFIGRSGGSKVACVVYDLADGLLANDGTNDTIASSIVNGSITLTVNSRIVSLVTSLPPSFTQKLSDPLNLTLQLTASNYRSKRDPLTMQLETRCVFWDTSKASVSNFGRGLWSTDGCIKLWEDEQSVTCSCYHLTSFAVLMQPVPAATDKIHAKILAGITYILTSLSLICLLIFIGIIVCSRRLHGELYILHLSLAGALLAALIAFILTHVASEIEAFCKAIGVIMHVFFVAAMALLLAESIWLFHAVVKGVIRGRIKWLLPVALLLPVVIVSAVVGINSGSIGSQPMCWPRGIYAWSFLGPLVAFGVFAIFVLLVVVCNLSEQAIKRRDIQAELNTQARRCAALAPLLTLPWLFAVALFLWSSLPMHYLFIIFSSVQGIWVFLCLGLLNPDFRDAAATACASGHVAKRSQTASSVRVTGIQDIVTSSASLNSEAPPIYHGSSSAATAGSRSALQSQSQPEVDEEDRNFGSRVNLRGSLKSTSNPPAGEQQQQQHYTD